MTPNEFPELFASIILGEAFEYVSPGVVTLTGHDREQSWDVAAAKGQVGASSVHNGANVGEFQASFFLASPEDQIAWPAFQRVLEGMVEGPEARALPIYHPDLCQNHYTDVSVKSIGGILRDDRGGVTVQVRFIEYRPPKPKPAATAKAKPGTGAGAGGVHFVEGKQDPNLKRKQELDELLQRAATP